MPADFFLSVYRQNWMSHACPPTSCQTLFAREFPDSRSSPVFPVYCGDHLCSSSLTLVFEQSEVLPSDKSHSLTDCISIQTIRRKDPSPILNSSSGSSDSSD